MLFVFYVCMDSLQSWRKGTRIRNMCNRRWMPFMLMLELLYVMPFSQGKPIITIEPANRYTDTTLTITCEIPGITLSSMVFKKDGTALYTCPLTNLPCSHKDSIGDYSSVDWSTQYKGIIQISNANPTRDSGEWTCVGNSGTDPSDPKRLEVTGAVCGQHLTIYNGYVEYQGDTYGDTAEYKCNTDYVIEGNTTTTCKANGEWSEVSPVCLVSETNNEDLYWLLLLVLLLCVVLVIVIVIVSGHKTLVISTLNLKVTKNTVELSWQPEFEPVPNTTYAKCAQNGLTENAEFTNGSIVIVFQNLTPERQHDVTIYCQNQADMKLYKSETFEVFTLKDSSNTNPKESKTVLSLH